jgi:hypothetical protein
MVPPMLADDANLIVHSQHLLHEYDAAPVKTNMTCTHGMNLLGLIKRSMQLVVSLVH